MSGVTCAARLMSTQSWNDAASTTSGPKRSHAHSMADVAGFVSSSRDTAASSARSGTTDSCCGSAVMAASCGALAVADLRDVRPGLIEVDVELRVLGRVGELVEVGQRLADRGGTAAAVEPAAERLAGLAVGRELAHHAHDGLRRGLGRQLRGLLAELDLHVAHATAEQHLIARRGLTVRPPLEAEEADVGDVVLAARVRAARDVDADAADLGETRLLERVVDVAREPARLRDGEV